MKLNNSLLFGISRFDNEQIKQYSWPKNMVFEFFEIWFSNFLKYDENKFRKSEISKIINKTIQFENILIIKLAKLFEFIDDFLNNKITILIYQEIRIFWKVKLHSNIS